MFQSPINKGTGNHVFHFKVREMEELFSPQRSNYSDEIIQYNSRWYYFGLEIFQAPDDFNVDENYFKMQVGSSV